MKKAHILLSSNSKFLMSSDRMTRWWPWTLKHVSLIFDRRRIRLGSFSSAGRAEKLAREVERATGVPVVYGKTWRWKTK